MVIIYNTISLDLYKELTDVMNHRKVKIEHNILQVWYEFMPIIEGAVVTLIADFDRNWTFSDRNSSLYSPMALRWWTKLEAA